MLKCLPKTLGIFLILVKLLKSMPGEIIVVISMQVLATAVFNESQFLHFYVASNNTIILYFYKVCKILKGCGIVFMQQELFGQVCMFIK